MVIPIAQIFRSYFDLSMADSAELKNECYHLRWQVYCQELGYEAPYQYDDLREMDQEDEQAVHVLLRHRETGIAVGTARLILPDPKDPEKLFPVEILAKEAFFASHWEEKASWPRDQIGEFSRFAISSPFRRRTGEHRHPEGISPQAIYQDNPFATPRSQRRFPSISLGLIAGSVHAALAQERAWVYALMEPALLRLLARFGVVFHPVGEPISFHGQRVPTVVRIPDLITSIQATTPDMLSFMPHFQNEQWIIGQLERIEGALRRT